MGATVAVAGASGYAGGELLRLLAGHPDLEIGPVAAHGSAGTSVTALHPQLTGHPGLRDSVFVPADPALFADADLLFTALPHGESARLAAELPAHILNDDRLRVPEEKAWLRSLARAPQRGQIFVGLEIPCQSAHRQFQRGGRSAGTLLSRNGFAGGSEAVASSCRKRRKQDLSG